MIICPHCGTQNQPGARFCIGCSAALSLPRDAQGALLPNVMLGDQGRYTILRLLGLGGFGAVYLAEDKRLHGRQCAIKETFERTPAAQQQFELEASLLARLDHPQLVRVTDYFSTPVNELFLVMDYVPGDDLAQVLQRNPGFLPEAQVVDWIGQVCDVLTYMHTWVDPVTGQPTPIIHRDLKPGNLKLLPGGRIKVIDLGIAKIKEPGRQTTRAARAVSAPYSPLEQYGAGGTDERSDVYALGVTLYELLTRQLPPEATERTYQSVLPPRQLRPDLSPAVEQVVMKAMQPAPTQRFQTVQEMKTALTQTGLPESNWQEDIEHLPSHEERELQPFIACEKCGRVDDTLRVTVFLYVISIILATFKRGWSAILCRTCSTQYSIIMILISLFLGPWGFPWGILYTLQAIVVNLGGGEQPKENNARLWVYQGLRYLERGEFVLASSCLSQSLRFQDDPGVRAQLEQIAPLASQQAESTPHPSSVLSCGPTAAGRRAIRRRWLTIGAVGVITLMTICLLLVGPQIGLAYQEIRNRFAAPPPLVAQPTLTISFISKPAAEINLQPADLGADFSLTEEFGRDAFSSSNLRDANRRSFESETMVIESTVAMADFVVKDTIPELMSGIERRLREEERTVSFGPLETISLGDRGGIEGFSAGDSGIAGYAVIFVERNVVVILLEVGPADQIQANTAKSHARIILDRTR